MLENFKSGNIISRLQELSKLASEFDLYEKEKIMCDFLPNSEVEYYTYTYSLSGNKEEIKQYSFTIDKVTYGFENRGLASLLYIKVNNMLIFHNRAEYSCNGLFEGVKAGWNHKFPKEMLNAIKDDVKIIDEHIKIMKYYLSDKDKHHREVLKLQEIFCSKE